MILTDSQVAQYHEQGYILVPALFSLFLSAKASLSRVLDRSGGYGARAGAIEGD